MNWVSCNWYNVVVPEKVANNTTQVMRELGGIIYLIRIGLVSQKLPYSDSYMIFKAGTK
jgi:hypothetical protein